HRRRHLHIRLPHPLLGAETQVNLLGEGDRERIAVDRSPVLTTFRIDRRERDLVTPRNDPNEPDRPQHRVARYSLVEPTLAGESPRAVDEHPNADALALRVGKIVDLAVLRDDELAAKGDRPSIYVGRARPQCRVNRCLGERLHAPRLTLATL